jgi:hypothetical protein
MTTTPASEDSAQRPAWRTGTWRWLFPLAFVGSVTLLAFIFHGGVSPNPLSRCLPVLSITERGTLSADPWARLTGDHAEVDGHIYSDKMPLSSFVVLPFYALWHFLRSGPYSRGDIAVCVLLGDVVASAIPFGAFTLLLMRRAQQWVRPRDAVVYALVGAFSTPLFSYAGTYAGHALAAALFAAAYDAATRTKRDVLAGALAGLAALTELPTAKGVVLLGAYVLLQPGGVRRFPRYVLGGAPSLVALGAYNTAVTGSPFDPPYFHLTAEFTRAHPYTLDLHSFWVASELLFSEFRGLFVYAPALLLLFPLAVIKSESWSRRALLLALFAVEITFLSSFWMWDGGWAIGPRHLAVLMSVLLLEGIDAVARTPGARAPFWVLAAVGLVLNLAAVSTNPYAPSLHPFRELYLPALAQGRIAPDTVFHMLGFPLGRGSVVVWMAAFALAAYGLGRLAEWVPRAVRERPRAHG